MPKPSQFLLPRSLVAVPCRALLLRHIVSFYFYTCLSYYETKHCLEHDPHEMDIMSAFIHSYFQPLMQGLACRQHSVSTK